AVLLPYFFFNWDTDIHESDLEWAKINFHMISGSSLFEVILANHLEEVGWFFLSMNIKVGTWY
ncbi:MAG: hypothetical protein M3Q77_06250, partial [Thermoproteota archaeon]|nr:hypothetical protein [Thermoproteota archaeon]